MTSRKRYVGQLTRYLQSDHSPRLEMAAVLGTTGLSGFLVSVALLKAGLEAMSLRYPIAAAAAYVVFLMLVWNLVRIYRAEADRALSGEGEAAEARPGGSPGDLAPDVPGLVLCLALVAVYFVAAAPALFAELVLDSLLVGGLYRRLRREDECRWFVSALRRTVWPAVMVVVFLALAGIGFSQYAPEAKSIGGVVAKWRAGHE